MKIGIKQLTNRGIRITIFNRITRINNSVKHNYTNLPFYLISGIGRSGTTALRLSFGLHELIDATGKENNIITDSLECGYRNCTIRKNNLLVEQNYYDKNFRQIIQTYFSQMPKRTIITKQYQPILI